MTSLTERLIAAHRQLNREIRRERARRIPNALRLSRLKKERLAVKDRLARILPGASELRRAVAGMIRRERAAG